MGFPNVVSGPITIWPRYVHPSTGLQINVRCVLQGCFWDADSDTIFQRTGTQVQETAKIYVPYSKEVTGRQYITPEEWAQIAPDEIDRYWTVNMRLSHATIIAKGDNPKEFSWGAQSQVTSEQNAFVSANPSVRTIRYFNPQTFGSKSRWHFLIRAI